MEKTTLLKFSSKNYHKIIDGVLNDFHDEKVCYVSFMKPYMELFNDLNNPQNFFIIDCVTNKGEIPEIENCLFLNDLKKLDMKILQTAKKNKCTVIILDNVASMLNYLESSEIFEVAHTIRPHKNSYFFILNDSELHNINLEKDLLMLADEIIHLE